MFNRDKEYTIETEKPLELYDTFSLSIRKFDQSEKSYNYDNIVCLLKYYKRGTLEIKELELDRINFSGFYMFVESFKSRDCLTMGEAIEIVQEKVHDEFEHTTLDNADEELKTAFNKYINDNNIMECLFKAFLTGVSYGKRKK